MKPPHDESRAPVRLRPEGGPFWRAAGGFDTAVRLLADDAAVETLRDDGPLSQLRQVAGLPGIMPPIVAMPGLASALGVPRPCVIVADSACGGVVIPAAVGHGIGNGTHAVALPWEGAAIQERAEAIAQALRSALSSTDTPMDDPAFDAVCTGGIAWGVEQGWGHADDAAACEHRGAMTGADPAALSNIARSYGRAQFGILDGDGAFASIFQVESRGKGTAFGLEQGQAVLIVRAGSRALGHQVTEDAIESMARASLQHRIRVPQRALACVPAHSLEGRVYLAGMAAAVNFAAAHRQYLAHRSIAGIQRVLGDETTASGARVMAEHTHQSASIQLIREDGNARRPMLVHRKGCIALDAESGRLCVLTAAKGNEAWLVAPGPGARSTFHSASDLADAGALRVQREAKIVRVIALLKAIVNA